MDMEETEGPKAGSKWMSLSGAGLNGPKFFQGAVS